MRITLLLVIISTLSTGCFGHRVHRGSYNSCVGCDGFEAPLMQGPNRKEERELRRWYRQLNRSETLASIQGNRYARQAGRSIGGCPCCESGMIDGGFCGSEGCGSDMCGMDSMGYPQTSYMDDAGDGWIPTDPQTYGYQDPGMVYEGDAGSSYCPSCRQKQMQQNDSQMIAPSVPTPMNEDHSTPEPVPAAPETTYLPSDYYSPPVSSVPATLPAPILNRAQPVEQTLWAPTQH